MPAATVSPNQSLEWARNQARKLVREGPVKDLLKLQAPGGRRFQDLASAQEWWDWATDKGTTVPTLTFLWNQHLLRTVPPEFNLGGVVNRLVHDKERFQVTSTAALAWVLERPFMASRWTPDLWESALRRAVETNNALVLDLVLRTVPPTLGRAQRQALEYKTFEHALNLNRWRPANLLLANQDPANASRFLTVSSPLGRVPTILQLLAEGGPTYRMGASAGHAEGLWEALLKTGAGATITLPEWTGALAALIENCKWLPHVPAVIDHVVSVEGAPAAQRMTETLLDSALHEALKSERQGARWQAVCSLTERWDSASPEWVHHHQETGLLRRLLDFKEIYTGTNSSLQSAWDRLHRLGLVLTEEDVNAANAILKTMPSNAMGNGVTWWQGHEQAFWQAKREALATAMSDLTVSSPASPRRRM